MRRSRLMSTRIRPWSTFTRALLGIMLALLIAAPFAPVLMPAIGFAPLPTAADPHGKMLSTPDNHANDGLRQSLALLIPAIAPQTADAQAAVPDGITLHNSGTGTDTTTHWQRTNEPAAYEGVVATTTTPGDTLILRVTGDSFTLYRRIGPDGGQMNVTKDGEDLGTLEFHFFEERWSVPAYFDHLGEGTHTLTFTLLDTGHRSATGTRVGIEAVEVPGRMRPTPIQTAAVDHVNHYRAQVGLPPGRSSAALLVAAQHHADFVATEWKDDCIASYPVDHYACPETAPGYTGYSPADRDRYVGYTDNYAGEGITLVDDPYAAVDEWMSMPYHRDPIMSYELDEVGYGHAIGVTGVEAGESAGVLKQRQTIRAPDERLLYTYPIDNQSGVRVSWSNGEQPDPLPGKPLPVGSLISFYIAQPFTTTRVLTDAWRVTQTALSDANGNAIPIYALHKPTDQNLRSSDIIHIVPQSPLSPATTYTAHVAGTDRRGVPFEHSWSFTTATSQEVTRIAAATGATGSEIRWSFPTPETVVTRVEYGPTPSYGQQTTVPDNTFVHEGQHFYTATLPDLQPDTTYHYRIVTEDAEGNVYPTENRTLTTAREAATLRVPEDVPDLLAAASRARYGDTVVLAAGTYTVTDQLWFKAGVHLCGAGQGETILRSERNNTLLNLRMGSQISALTLAWSGTPPSANDNRTALWVQGNATPVIRNVHITGFYVGVNGGNPTIVQSLFTNNRFGIFSGLGSARIINTTIVGGETGIVLGASGSVVINTIIAQQSKEGIGFPDDSNLTSGYNSFWGNGKNAQWGYTCESTGDGGPRADWILISGD